MELLLSFANIFLPPSIALMGCYRRKSINTQHSPFLHYLFATAVLYFLLTLELWAYEIFFFETMDFSARKVLIIAMIQSFLYPYFYEFIKKYNFVSVEINEQNKV